MKVGEKITFSFANQQKEGLLHKMNEKSVIIKADFPRHKGKLIRRKLSDVHKGGKPLKGKRAKGKKRISKE